MSKHCASREKGVLFTPHEDAPTLCAPQISKLFSDRSCYDLPLLEQSQISTRQPRRKRLIVKEHAGIHVPHGFWLAARSGVVDSISMMLPMRHQRVSDTAELHYIEWQGTGAMQGCDEFTQTSPSEMINSSPGKRSVER